MEVEADSGAACLHAHDLAVVSTAVQPAPAMSHIATCSATVPCGRNINLRWQHVLTPLRRVVQIPKLVQPTCTSSRFRSFGTSVGGGVLLAAKNDSTPAAAQLALWFGALGLRSVAVDRDVAYWASTSWDVTLPAVDARSHQVATNLRQTLADLRS